MLSDFDELLIELPLVNALSVRTANFAQKRSRLWNFSCPYPDCGDNATRKDRARGYIFEYKHRLQYKCHNCGRSSLFSTLLKDQFPDIYQELKIQRYREKRNSAPIQYLDETKEADPPKQTIVEPPWVSIADLDAHHPAYQYVLNRKIPRSRWTDLYYVEKYGEFVRQMGQKNSRLGNDPRIVLPYRSKDGKLIGFSGRSMDLVDNRYKYLSVKLDDDAEMVYRLNELSTNRPFIVVEGPIDSLFLENAIAVSGAKLDAPSVVKENSRRAILVADNEPRSKIIVKNIARYIDEGYKVFLWPPSWKYKDINKAVQEGVEAESIERMILDGSASGMKARANLAFWRQDIDIRKNHE